MKIRLKVLLANSLTFVALLAALSWGVRQQEMADLHDPSHPISEFEE
jgi:hypothetical protein